MSLYIDLIDYYCKTTKHDYTKHSQGYISDILAFINDPSDEIVQKVNTCFQSVLDKLQTENRWAVIPQVRDAVENTVNKIDPEALEVLKVDNKDKIKLFENPKAVKFVSSILIDSILHSGLQTRIDSAVVFKYLINYTDSKAIKTEVIKICGALIRVSNDKFPPELKHELFQAMRLMLVKTPLFIKAMVAQLQTTFLKAFSD